MLKARFPGSHGEPYRPRTEQTLGAYGAQNSGNVISAGTSVFSVKKATEEVQFVASVKILIRVFLALPGC